MSTPRLLSLAAGVCPETGPADFVAACATAGWEACGIWFDHETWTAAVATDVRRRLDDTGVVALDMEPVFVTPDGDHGNRMVEAAATVGARNLLVVSRGVDDDRFAERFAELCDLAAPHGIGCSIEFLAFMSVSSLGQSIEILDRIDRPNGGVLVDALHLARTGGTPADVASIRPERLAYAQLCDGPAETPADAYFDALDGRSTLGDGGLAIAELVTALPAHTALSMEIRSARLRSAFADATARARHVLETTTTWFEAFEPVSDERSSESGAW
jgi:sugar phosphate isomerase/epimerase